ncbi:hypothetical protein GCM10023257_64090 [Streptomyces hyderabadensis]|uniref:Transposase Helix-turn-helix domain-containing protein n=1 Tax=Streptomyces hyderabadensis TaxID=598549 RepID=A0ABP9ISL4_9ACTN
MNAGERPCTPSSHLITASDPAWISPFSELSPRQFGKLITSLRREGADPVRRGRPWGLPLEDRVLLVAAYWRTNLTLRQLAPLFGVSKSAADRITDHLGPALAPQQRKRFRTNTVLIVDGTLVPTRDHSIAEQSKTSHVIGGQLSAWQSHLRPQGSEVRCLVCRSHPITSRRVVRRTPERVEYAGRRRGDSGESSCSGVGVDRLAAGVGAERRGRGRV